MSRFGATKVVLRFYLVQYLLETPVPPGKMHEEMDKAKLALEPRTAPELAAYSYRKARTGSTPSARRAGHTAATAIVTAKTAIAPK